MTHSPELLPDHDGWSKSLYEAVKKDAEHVVAGHLATGSSLTPEAEYHRLIQLLSADTMNEILKNGARLGTQLVELEGVGMAWKLLADFWSEKILFATPSDNLKGHAEAIARGGELITLLWVLLFHAGIVNRPGNAAGAV
ncbi:hypothetical protein QOZ80_8BG0649950 [Eleusine coracana subsp. coracana]|nr:hypothetical protein QOZ80_8BG0649950 [Eleusine coracana subsp. coracana]